MRKLASVNSDEYGTLKRKGWPVVKDLAAGCKSITKASDRRCTASKHHIADLSNLLYTLARSVTPFGNY